MATRDRIASRFSRKRKTSSRTWMSALALGIGAVTAAIGISRGRSNRWIQKMKNKKMIHFHN